jgi:hypothetical protein
VFDPRPRCRRKGAGCSAVSRLARWERSAAAGHDGAGGSSARPGQTPPWTSGGISRTDELLGLRGAGHESGATGDIHSNWVNDLNVDAADPKSPVVATEFVGTSITSGSDGFDGLDTFKGIASENPFVKFYNSQRGYVSCEITPKQMRAEYRVLDYVTRPDSPRKTRAVFIVEDGRAGAHQTEGA